MQLTQEQVDTKVTAVAEANDLKQQEILDSLVGIHIQSVELAATTTGVSGAVRHAIAETAKVYEEGFHLEVAAEGCATEFMGAADRFLEYVNS